jgi:sporulation protein YlmC with PRC-barrel domain
MTHFLTSTALSLVLFASAGALAQTATSGVPANASPVTQQQSGEYLADDVIGATVRNAQDENIGSVADLVIDQNGQVKAAVLSVGGFLGIGDKHVAVPWNEVKIGAARRASATGSPAGSADTARDPAVMVNMTKDELKQAPAFRTIAQQQREMERARTAPGTTTGPATRTPSQ